MFDLVSSTAKRDRKIAMNQPCHHALLRLCAGGRVPCVTPQIAETNPILFKTCCPSDTNNEKKFDQKQIL
jgi:hypothetical protein